MSSFQVSGDFVVECQISCEKGSEAVDYSNLTDEGLLALIARGDPDALSELYRRHNRLVYSLAAKMLADSSLAEEISLDVFTRVWEQGHTYRADQAKASTWLTSITRYRCIDLLRRQKSYPTIQQIPNWDETIQPAAPDRENPEEKTQLSMQQARIRAALDQLPDDQRTALALAYFRGLTHRQVADTLDQPLGTIKTRIRLALQKLREILRDED
jgi:RNA polymerase sigma-70 factor (ECF subfamily)